MGQGGRIGGFWHRDLGLGRKNQATGHGISGGKVIITGRANGVICRGLGNLPWGSKQWDTVVGHCRGPA